MERSFVPLGETSHVSCEKTTSSSILSWIIDLPNGISEDAFSTDPALMARGITLQMDTSHLNLSMLASTENNGTVVTCRELFQSSEVFSAPILLIVIGELSPNSLKFLQKSLIIEI